LSELLELSEVDSFVELLLVEASGAIGVVGFPDASVEDDENNENDSKFGENNDSILVVPPNNDEIISFYKKFIVQILIIL
jgi:hypothetical protein